MQQAASEDLDADSESPEYYGYPSNSSAFVDLVEEAPIEPESPHHGGYGNS